MLTTPNMSPLFVPRACSNRSSPHPRPMSRSPALTCGSISTPEGLSCLEPDAVQDSCAQVLDCCSGNAAGVGSGQPDIISATGYKPIMTHAILRGQDRAHAASSSAGRKAMLRRIFLAIFAGPWCWYTFGRRRAILVGVAGVSRYVWGSHFCHRLRRFRPVVSAPRAEC